MRVPRWLRRTGVALLLLVGIPYGCYELSWEGIDVVLPDGAGILTFSRRPMHPFLAEDDYHVRVVLADGRTLSDEIEPNWGGRTMVLLHWQPAAENGGPFLLIEDSGTRWAWINLGRPCLEIHGDHPASKPCTRGDLPRSQEWLYFGRIDDRGDQPGMRFVPGSEMPRHLDLPFGEIMSDSIPVAGTQWSFTIFERPHPLDERYEHWVLATNPQGVRIWSWFKDDLFRSHATTVSLYPAQGGMGPFLRFGQFERGLFDSETDCIVLDLGQARAFHLFGYHGVGPKFMIAIEDELRGRISVTWRGHDYEVQNDGGPVPPVLPVPEVLQRERPITLGRIRTWPDTKWLDQSSHEAGR